MAPTSPGSDLTKSFLSCVPCLSNSLLSEYRIPNTKGEWTACTPAKRHSALLVYKASLLSVEQLQKMALEELIECFLLGFWPSICIVCFGFGEDPLVKHFPSWFKLVSKFFHYGCFSFTVIILMQGFSCQQVNFSTLIYVLVCVRACDRMPVCG